MLIAQSNIAQAISIFKEAGAWAIGLEGSEESQPAARVNLKGPLALVVGSEGAGHAKAGP